MMTRVGCCAARGSFCRYGFSRACSRRLFLDTLRAAHQAGRLAFFGDRAALAEPRAFAAFLAPLRKAEWVVYAKSPFAGPHAIGGPHLFRE